MKIETTRVCAAATKNYQKFEFEVTATEVSPEDLIKLETLTIQEAIKGINLLDPSKEEPKVEVVKEEAKTNPMPPRPANGNNGIITEMKEFTNEKGFTTSYKKCFNKSTGQYFYALVDEKQLAFGWPKFKRYEG